MDIYEEINQKRIERYTRRMAKIERDNRRENVLATIKFAAMVMLVFVLMYSWLFLGCLLAAV